MPSGHHLIGKRVREVVVQTGHPGRDAASAGGMLACAGSEAKLLAQGGLDAVAIGNLTLDLGCLGRLVADQLDTQRVRSYAPT